METRESVINNFRWFAIVASTNHALNYVVNSFATSLLGPSLGSLAMGLNWILNAFSGLFLATPIVQLLGAFIFPSLHTCMYINSLAVLGFRSSMILAFWGYTFQAVYLLL